MENINWLEIKEYEVIQGLFGKFFHTKTMTFVLWRFEAGADGSVVKGLMLFVVLC